MSVYSLSPLTLRAARAYLAERSISAPFHSRLAIGVTDHTGNLAGVVIAGGPVPGWTSKGPTLAVTRLHAEKPAAAVLLSLAIRRASASLGYRDLVAALPAHPFTVGTALRATGWTCVGDTPNRLAGQGDGWGERWTTSSRYFDHTPTTVCLGARRWWQRCPATSYEA